MSPSPIESQSFSGPSPYTPTDGIDTASFASMASTFSNVPAIFTSLTPAESSASSAASAAAGSVGASLRSKLSISSDASASQRLSQSTTFNTITSPVASTTPSDVAAASSASASQQSVSASSASEALTATATAPNDAGSSTAATASSAANSSSDNLQAEASTMSSSGKQAAIAVPIVVAVLAAIALIFFCMRRRRKRRAAAEGTGTIEKMPVAARKKNWTRHFRVFSFDTELLMGGRYSSTNSIRSRQTGSLRSATRSQHSETPSIHSVDEVAPPYRDALSSAQPPSIAQVMAGAAAGNVAAGVDRSASNATAPPPYGATAGALRTPSPTTPVSQRPDRNPFADSPPVSPVEASPFNDPPGTSPPISRNSSVNQSDSDAASIRQATLARNASVMSGGRVIHNVSGRPS